MAEEHQTATPSSPDVAEELQRTPSVRDAFAIKTNLRKQLLRPEYDVAMYYHKRGIYQWIARHPWFEKMTLCVIAANSIWIGVDTDYNKASVLLEAPPLFQVVEHIFTVYFLFEWTMRFLSFKIKRDTLRDGWFVFDSALVCSMLFDNWLVTAIVLAGGAAGGGVGATSILRLVRLLRLTRMARMARLLRAVPELVILMRGMLAAMRATVITIFLLVVIIYIFAIAFTQMCDSTDCGDIFPSVPASMNVLFSKATLIDSFSDLTVPLQQQNLGLLFLLYLYVFLAFLTVFNMLTGVILEVVTGVASSETEMMKVSYVKERIQELVKQGADADGDHMISKKEFMDLLSNDKAIVILHSIGVDVIELVDCADTIFKNYEEQNKLLSFEEFMDVILNLRGSNFATVRDIVELRKFFTGRIASLQHVLEAKLLNQRTVQGSSQLGDDTILGNRDGKALESKVASKLQHLINQSLKEIVDIHQHEVSALRAENCKLRAEPVSISGRTFFSGAVRTFFSGAASSEMTITDEATPLPTEGMPRERAQQCSDAMPTTQGEELLEGSMLNDQQPMRHESTAFPESPCSPALDADHEPGGQPGREGQEASDAAAVSSRPAPAKWRSRRLAAEMLIRRHIIGKPASDRQL